MKLRSCDIDLLDQRIETQFGGDLLGEIARLEPSILRQHHRDVRRHVAMRCVARRFDHDAREIERRRQRARAHQRLARGSNAALNVGEEMGGRV